MPTGRELIGLLAGVVVLAGFAVAVKNGTGVAAILQAGGQSFANVITAATRAGG